MDERREEELASRQPHRPRDDRVRGRNGGAGGTCTYSKAGGESGRSRPRRRIEKKLWEVVSRPATEFGPSGRSRWRTTQGLNSQRATGVRARVAHTRDHRSPGQSDRASLRPSASRVGSGVLDGRLWTAAALCLWQAHADDPTLPLDSELFVASQPLMGSLGDPWVELTQVEAGRRYRIQVRRIVRRLRRELTREIRRAERLMTQAGGSIGSSLSGDAPPLSAGVLHRRAADGSTRDRGSASPSPPRNSTGPARSTASRANHCCPPTDIHSVYPRPRRSRPLTVAQFQEVDRDELIESRQHDDRAFRRELTRMKPSD